MPPIERAKRAGEKQSFYMRLSSPLMRIVLLRGASRLIPLTSARRSPADDALLPPRSSPHAAQLHPWAQPRRHERHPLAHARQVPAPDRASPSSPSFPRSSAELTSPSLLTQYFAAKKMTCVSSSRCPDLARADAPLSTPAGRSRSSSSSPSERSATAVRPSPRSYSSHEGLGLTAVLAVFGFVASLMERIPLVGLVFSISNRIGAAMWAHDVRPLSLLSLDSVSLLEHRR